MEVGRLRKVAFVRETDRYAVCSSCCARQGTARIYAVMVGITHYESLCMECARVLAAQIAGTAQEEEARRNERDDY